MKKNKILNNKIFFLLLSSITAILFSNFLLIKIQIAQIEADYIYLSNKVTTINSNLVLQYVRNIGQWQDDNLTNELTRQIYPLIELHLPDTKMIPHFIPIQRLDYIRGYMSAWQFVILDTGSIDQRLINLLGCGIRVGPPYSTDANNVTFLGGISISLPGSRYSREDENNKLYNEGWEAGSKKANLTYNKTKNDCSYVLRKYLEQDWKRAERFELIKEQEVQDRLSKVPSFQALIIITRLLEETDQLR
jgi:hypothetical protein